METTPTLTIAIPTYNRFRNLEFIVDKLLPFLNNNTTILIIDNNSTDGTDKYCKKINSKHVIYFQNKVNIGGTVNMLRCVEMSTGQYTWLLGDDDNIDPTLLSDLVYNIKEEQCCGYHLVNMIRRRDFKITRFKFENKGDFIHHFYDVTAVSLMATNIFRTSEAQNFLIEAYRLVHLQHAFSLFFAKFLDNHKCVAILNLPILQEEQKVAKRWSRFTAHIDALETNFILYGKSILRREYYSRRNHLLRIGLYSAYSDKDEGFSLKELSRLFHILGMKYIFLIIILSVLLFNKNFDHVKRINIYFVMLYFRLKYKNNKNSAVKLRQFFSLPDSGDIIEQLISRSKNPKSLFRN